MNILIVEDSLVIIQVLKTILESAGYSELLIASSGPEAFEILDIYELSSNRATADLILMDIKMPGINGIEACHKIKRTKKYQDIPIIMVTSSSEEMYLEEAFSAGAIDYITKPINRVILLARIRAALKLKQEMDRAKAATLEFAKANIIKQRQIIEREQAQEELKRSEEKYRSLIENIPDITWTTDSNGVSHFISPNVERVCGFTQAEIYQDKKSLWFDRVHPDYLASIVEAYKRLFEDGVKFDVEYQIQRKDGQWIWLHDRAIATYEKDGIMYADGMFTDITRRKEIEAALRNSEQQYRLLFESNPQPMWIFEIDSLRFLAVNKAAMRHYGYSQAEFLAMTIKDIRSADEIPALLNDISNSSSGFGVPGIWRHKKKDGTFIDVDVVTHGLLFGERPAKLALLTDVTERKRAEEALLSSNIILTTQQESSLDGILVVDEQGKIKSFNQRFIDIWGIPTDITASHSDEQALQYVLNKLVDPENFLARIRYLYEHTDQRSQEEILLIDGRIIDRYSAPMIGSTGKYFGRVWYFRDITERKGAEKILEARARQQQAVAKLGQQALAGIELSRLMELATTLVSETLDVEYCKILEHHSESNRLLLQDGAQTALAERTTLSFDEETLSGYTLLLLSQEPVIIKDLRKETRFKVPKRLRELGVISSMSVIIPGSQGPFGALTADTTRERSFTKDDAYFLLAVANLLAVAIERRESEAALRTSEERYRMLFDSNPNPIMVTDERTLAVLQVNNAALHHYGYTHSEFLDMTIKDIAHPEDLPEILHSFSEVLPLNITKKMVRRHKKKDGDIIIVELSVHSINYAGKGARLAVITDITRYKQAEEAIAERARLSALGSDVGVALTQGHGLVDSLRRCSEAMVEHLGAAFARIWTLNSQENILELQASAGLYTHIDGAHSRIPVGMFKIGLIAQDRQPHLTNSVIDDPRISDQAWARRENIIAFAGFPLIVEDRLVGVMAIFSRAPLTNYTLQAMRAVANEIALGIERKQVEEELRRSEERYRLLFDNNPHPSMVFEVATLHFLTVNDEAVRHYGYSREEFLTMTLLDLAFPEDIPELIKALPDIADIDLDARIRRRHRRKDGTAIDVEVFAHGIKFAGEQARLAVMTDITERVTAEKRLNIQYAVTLIMAETSTTSEAFQQILQTICKVLDWRLATVWLVDQNTNLIRCSDVWSEPSIEMDSFKNLNLHMTFAPGIGLPGRIWADRKPCYITDLSSDNSLPRSANALKAGLRSMLGFPILLENNVVGVVELFSQTVRQFDDNLLNLMDAIGNQLGQSIDRKRKQEKVREQAALLDITLDAVMVRDLEDNILYWNKGAQQTYGWMAEEVIGRNAQQLLYKGDLDPATAARQKVIERGQWTGELEQITRSGNKITVECRWTLMCDEIGNPKSILVVNTNITEKKRLQLQFLRSQRIDSLGTLASGIAHDLNNVLAPVLMSLQLIKKRLLDERSQQIVLTLETTVNRGAELIKQILSFSRGMEGEHTFLQITCLIKEIVGILKETFPRSIIIQTEIPDDLWTISGNATQLQQVLMNLCVNARDAMPQGGKLTISAENLLIDKHYAQMNIDANPGDYIIITISDNGIGISPGLLDKIFDPFFTTKELGKGTGLGLSTVIGIIKSYRGFVRVNSEPGLGSKFSLYLPAIKTEPAEQSPDIIDDLPMGQQEMILVVDDERAIREITRATLEAYNYRVLTASDGSEAIALYAQHREQIEVVITDMMMPVMDGKLTIRALQRLNPQVKIIGMTGLVTNNDDLKWLNVTDFLIKPYTADVLLTRVYSKILEKK